MSDINTSKPSINMSDVAAKLTVAFDELFDGVRDAKDCVELSNMSGKIISAYKTKLGYHALRGERPIIPFLADETEGPSSLGGSRAAALAAS